MTVQEAIQDVGLLFLDTAPTIYLVERNPRFFPAVQAVFNHIDSGILHAITSPITLSECLVGATQKDLPLLQQGFEELITNGPNTTFQPINRRHAVLAADLRVRYNLLLPDSLQVAARSSPDVTP